MYQTGLHKKSASLEDSRQTIPENTNHNANVGQRSGFLVKQIEKIYRNKQAEGKRINQSVLKHREDTTSKFMLLNSDSAGMDRLANFE